MTVIMYFNVICSCELTLEAALQQHRKKVLMNDDYYCLTVRRKFVWEDAIMAM